MQYYRLIINLIYIDFHVLTHWPADQKLRIIDTFSNGQLNR